MEERERLIKQLGGTVSNYEIMSDEEIIQLSWDTYLNNSKLPPELQLIFDDTRAERLSKVDHICDIIEEKRKLNPDLMNFNPAISLEEIEKFELETCLILPPSYRQFLQKYNGGYIGNRNQNIKILGLDELRSKYEERRDRAWKIHFSFQGIYPYIPVIKLDEVEFLIFIHNRRLVGSPLFKADYYKFSPEWKLINFSFVDFLDEYVENMGALELLPKPDTKPAADFTSFSPS